MVDETSSQRLPLPDVVNWPNFPFEGDLRVRHLEPPTEEEAARIGETDTTGCTACFASDADYLWSNETWRVKTLAPFSPLPVSLILETRTHIDLDDFDDTLAAELGRIIVELTRATEAMPEVGRLHTYRWGDGARHFHVWFLGRPYGAEQLRGLTLPLWGLTIPPLATSVTDPINAAVAQYLSDQFA